MEQLHACRKAVNEYRKHVLLCPNVISVEAGLCHFNIPIAELCPDKVIDFLRRKVHVERVEVLGYFAHYAVKPVEYPFVGNVEHGRVDIVGYIDTLGVHYHEARGVVYLVAEVARGLDFLLIIAHIIARGITCDKTEPERIRAVFAYDFERIYAVAERL